MAEGMAECKGKGGCPNGMAHAHAEADAEARGLEVAVFALG